MSNIETHKSTICLNMIVKNEVHILKRCLESVKPFIDTWVISDTGSTDGTQALIKEVMKDIPGELIEHEWENFGHNRNQALEHSHGKADYILTIDADEWLEFEEGMDFKNLSADSYYIIKDQGDKRYWVRNIIKNNMGWKWQGVLHEVLECPDAKTYDDFNHAVIQARQEGARAHDPDTYRKDAVILTKALIDEPNNTRYQFYLAQSWRDADENELAIMHYKRRIEMGGWSEEIFYSKYQIAKSMEKLGRDWNDCMEAYLDAWSHTPERAEPLFLIGNHYMQEKNWELARLFFQQAANIPRPEHLLLFIEEDIYKSYALFNAAVIAGNTGRFKEYLQYYEKLMAVEELDENLKLQAEDNHAFFMEKMGKEDVAA